METIDINKVAGLQALDSEGNVLGVVSMEQLTDMVAGKLATELAAQNTAPAMRTMSLQASPAAASVSATGVDKPEQQLLDVSDPKYVRVIGPDGNSGKQGISQFASVVGGLIKPLKYKLITNMETLNKGLTSFDEPVVPFYTGYIPQVTPSSNYAGGLAFTYYGIEGEIQILFDYSGKINIRNRSSNDGEFGDFRTL